MEVFCSNEINNLLNVNPSAAEWLRLLQWLHVSGLALYFFDRLRSLQLLDSLPPAIHAELEQALADNTLRSAAFLEETLRLNHAFQDEDILYANLKGITLCPFSVPRMELRSQLDLDFLVDPACAERAHAVLERCGYRLHAVSGKSMEFKTPGRSNPRLSDLYRVTPHRSVELHLEPEGSQRLHRVEWIQREGVSIPSLSPIDHYLGQALHLFKHIRGEFTRLSWFLEFRHHTQVRKPEAAFWTDLLSRLQEDKKTALGYGIAAATSQELLDEFVPSCVSAVTGPLLSPATRYWIAHYGRTALLTDFPGSKLYLLLEEELTRKEDFAGRPLRVALLPRRLPPAIHCKPEQDSLAARLYRLRQQIPYIFFRLRFHLVEGARYIMASMQWRQVLSGSVR
ncbi:nucleotidyltransferase domain-containing protein [Terriglobus albidus]|uniref:nucleotidyltransferase domain-containing protein n=1 Tax=Terriglobus albidus TaxID=1592106 RepID=UPI0021E0140A|nr:nucleotidyltransferase family protein [Terriglobus albidus]